MGSKSPWQHGARAGWVTLCTHLAPSPPAFQLEGNWAAHQCHSSAHNQRKQQGSIFQRHSTLYIVCKLGYHCDKANTHNSTQEFSPQGQ